MSGKALKNFDVSPIKRENLPRIVQELSEITEIPIQDFHYVGSTGRVGISGDIDLAVRSCDYDPTNAHQRLVDKFGSDRCVFNPGTKIGSYAFITKNDPEIEYVQVDLMFVTNLKWAKFAYYSPSPMISYYKGAVRTALLMGVTAQINQIGVDAFEHNEDVLIVRAGRTFDLNRGVRRIFQYRPRTKKGDRYLKNMKTLTMDKFFHMFPHLDSLLDHTDIIIDNPADALVLMFNQELNPHDVRSAEQVLELIYKTFRSDQQEQIFKKAANRLTSVRDTITIPSEILCWM